MRGTSNTSSQTAGGDPRREAVKERMAVMEAEGGFRQVQIFCSNATGPSQIMENVWVFIACLRIGTRRRRAEKP